MNLDKLKKNVGWRVQLDPPAMHLDRFGRPLPVKNEDWIIRNVTDSEVWLDEATMMGLGTRIAKDGLHHFSQNAARSETARVQCGFLTLALQMFIQNNVITYRPCRPGEGVAPPPATIAEKSVDLRYPTASGIQQRLESAGFELSWGREERVSTLVDLEGWEVVAEPDRSGVHHTFRNKGRDSDLILVKRRRR